jgi:hypothetical protein
MYCTVQPVGKIYSKTAFLSFFIFYFLTLHMQGCGGTLDGTIPSSGTLEWTINAASLMHVDLIFSDWAVSIASYLL